MKPIGRQLLKDAEEFDAEMEKEADQIFGFIVGALCVAGTGLFIYAFSSVLFAYFCE